MSEFRQPKRATEPTLPGMQTEIFQIERFATPTGRMLVLNDDRGRLRAIDWEDHKPRGQRVLGRCSRRTEIELREVTQKSPARRALDAYFAGELSAIDELET